MDAPTGDGSIVLEAYKGVLRVSVFVKGDYERAARVVVNPATDTWKSFIKEVLSMLRLRTDRFQLIRSTTKAVITKLADLRQNDVIMMDLEAEVIDDTPLTDSPLSVAKTKHMKVEGVGITNQMGPTFIVTCTKPGER